VPAGRARTKGGGIGIASNRGIGTVSLNHFSQPVGQADKGSTNRLTYFIPLFDVLNKMPVKRNTIEGKEVS
jgi:hypothetical protein